MLTLFVGLLNLSIRVSFFLKEPKHCNDINNANVFAVESTIINVVLNIFGGISE